MSLTVYEKCQKYSTCISIFVPFYFQLKSDFLKRIQKAVSIYSIPDELIINFDQTGKAGPIFLLLKI